MTTPKTPLDLDAIRARAEAATDGPWEHDTYRQVLAGLATMTGNHAADAAFVRHAREDVTALLAEVEQLRARIDAAYTLFPAWSYEPPPNGCAVVVETSGGWQNLPAKERAYIRSDRPEKPHVDGDWYQVGGDDYAYSWGELNWLDDPACDRGTVNIEVFVPADELERVLSGGAS